MNININYDQQLGRGAGLSRNDAGMSLLSATDGIPVGRFYDGNISQNILLKTSGYNQLDNVQLWNMMPNINTLTDRVKESSLP